MTYHLLHVAFYAFGKADLFLPSLDLRKKKLVLGHWLSTS
jgi:hypothetical protein